MKQRILFIFFATAMLFFGIGEKAYAVGLIVCGKKADEGTPAEMCTLCDIIRQMNVIKEYVINVGIFFMITLIVIGAIMYIASGGNPGLAETAKKTIIGAIVGFVIILAAWVLVNTTVEYLGAPGNNFGINVTSWGHFDCNSTYTDH